MEGPGISGISTNGIMRIIRTRQEGFQWSRVKRNVWGGIVLTGPGARRLATSGSGGAGWSITITTVRPGFKFISRLSGTAERSASMEICKAEGRTTDGMRELAIT